MTAGGDVAWRRRGARACVVLALAGLVLGIVMVGRAPSQAGAACRAWAAERGYVDAEHRLTKGDNCTARTADGAFVHTRVEAAWTTTAVGWFGFGGAVALVVGAAVLVTPVARAPGPTRRAHRRLRRSARR